MTRTEQRHAWIVGVMLLAGARVALGQVEPPDLINYQGVLRNAAGDAESGDFEMVFRFFDADVAGNELASDEHCAVGGPAVCAAESGAVTATGGLFNVQIGGSDLIDAAGGGDYTGDLPGIFRDSPDVWMQVEIYFPGPDPPPGFQVLSPRVRIVSAAYALNADHLDGFSSGAFAKLSPSNTFRSPNTFLGTVTIQTQMPVQN